LQDRIDFERAFRLHRTRPAKPINDVEARASCVCSSRRLAAQPMIDASEARLEYPSCEHRPLNFRGA
jgi:hypothetical protein